MSVIRPLVIAVDMFDTWALTREPNAIA